MTDNESYYVSLKHRLVQDMRGEAGEFEVKLEDTVYRDKGYGEDGSPINAHK
ncbi:hypothetical protein [Paenibacillus sabinae]|uniref:hypothetical protein n=1 Tax=Paenibacillus sabinae TaxID=365617 RepID=UPI000B0A19D8|nr:hypothetical protein [Paenibacillus sabinae]